MSATKLSNVEAEMFQIGESLIQLRSSCASAAQVESETATTNPVSSGEKCPVYLPFSSIKSAISPETMKYSASGVFACP